MKFSQLSLLAACVSARFIEVHETEGAQVSLTDASEEKFLVELAPGKTRWVTEEGKWELRRQGKNFIDITEHAALGETLGVAAKKETVTFPASCARKDAVQPLAAGLSKANMRANLEHLTGFWTRHYTTDYGLQSSQWVLRQVEDIIAGSGAGSGSGITARAFDHRWKQKSVIVTIPGRSNDTVVIGAHQDSTNLWLPTVLAAPGADDDGSGTVTIMEVLRALLASEAVRAGEAANTIEFHWYSAEEAGLLGSQDVFAEYAAQGRRVKAMLQQDMTGYVQTTLDKGEPESVGVIVDYVDEGLTEFIKVVIEEYCDIPWVETKCGYACSDHASASKAGYPAAFVIESAFENSDQHIHTSDDSIKYLSFDHMLQHAKMTLGLVYELGFHDFSKA
ncbi:Leucine aminopeptidase 1 [Escovopsis weberi]|uniref:Peptide hydrolase n=1 Tax=Escovopsis weberi TaxID=150374 RepID=A0A0M8NA98_ESCWE|nr:Leucine aminopeptidase 1 [Escovopsis weberi]